MNFKKGTKKWVLKIGAYKRVLKNGTYIKIASSNTSRLEAHVDFFQIAYEGDFQSLNTVTSLWLRLNYYTPKMRGHR